MGPRPSKDFGVGSEAVSTAAGLQEVVGTAVAAAAAAGAEVVGVGADRPLEPWALALA